MEIFFTRSYSSRESATVALIDSFGHVGEEGCKLIEADIAEVVE